MFRSELDAAIDNVLRGERDSFRKILQDYGLSLRSYIATWVHHSNDVDDLAQEVFLVAYRNLRDFRQEDDFGAWLRGIARNKIYHHLRNSSRATRPWVGSARMSPAWSRPDWNSPCPTVSRRPSRCS